MHLFNPFIYVERFEARKARSPADPRKVAPSLPAPVRLGQRVSTRNKNAWTEVALHLVGRPVNVRGEA